jgi:tRNA nucleotidyltransferase/poly(A) polymerase
MLVTLSTAEKELFSFLLKTAEPLQLTLRAAGGWVRDKLLNLESKDIDVSIDRMTGEEFAHHLVAFSKQQSNNSMSISGIGTIKSNPEKSKHLSTCTFNLNGFSIDLNNLRSEKYADSSRIPIVEIGTPKEDAERRDFTVNALFYNINIGEVEDFTEKGLQDLKDKKLRTPLDPKITFKDDPLRILRAIRFAARFEMSLAEDLLEALKNTEITTQIRNKVSGERVGIELTKMFTEKSMHKGIKALLMLFDFKIANILTSETSPYSFNVETLHKIANKFTDSAVPDSQLFFYSLLCTPISEYQERSAVKLKNSRVVTFLKDEIHVPKIVADQVSLILDGQKVIEDLVKNRNLVMTGRFLRKLKDNWKISLLIWACTQGNLEIISDLMKWIETETHLVNCWEWKAPFDGVALQKMFGLKPGPKLAVLLDKEYDLMFEGIQDPEVIKSKLEINHS